MLRVRLQSPETIFPRGQVGKRAASVFYRSPGDAGVRAVAESFVFACVQVVDEGVADVFVDVES